MNWNLGSSSETRSWHRLAGVWPTNSRHGGALRVDLGEPTLITRKGSNERISGLAVRLSSDADGTPGPK